MQIRGHHAGDRVGARLIRPWKNALGGWTLGFGGGSGVGEQGFVPVFPDGVEVPVVEEGGDFGGGAMIGDVELAGGGGGIFGGVLEFDPSSFDGQVQVAAAGAGVAAWFGVTTGAHGGDAERKHGIAQGGGFAGTEDDAEVREAQAEGAEHLHKVTVAQRVSWLEAAGGRA